MKRDTSLFIALLLDKLSDKGIFILAGVILFISLLIPGLMGVGSIIAIAVILPRILFPRGS